MSNGPKILLSPKISRIARKIQSSILHLARSCFLCIPFLWSEIPLLQIYNSQNPFDFMERISIEAKTNFFEKRVSEYQKAGVLSSDEGNSFTLDSDF